MTGTSLALTFFRDRGQGVSVIFGMLSLAMLCVLPQTLSIPDAARERRVQSIGLPSARPL